MYLRMCCVSNKNLKMNRVVVKKIFCDVPLHDAKIQEIIRVLNFTGQPQLQRVKANTFMKVSFCINFELQLSLPRANFSQFNFMQQLLLWRRISWDLSHIRLIHFMFFTRHPDCRTCFDTLPFSFLLHLGFFLDTAHTTFSSITR